MKLYADHENMCCMCRKPLIDGAAAKSTSGFPLCRKCLHSLEGYSRRVVVARVYGEQQGGEAQDHPGTPG